MAKNSKKSKELPAQENNPASPSIEPRNGSGTADPAKLSGAKKAADSTGRAKAPAKSRGAMPRKPVTGRKPRARATEQTTPAADALVKDEQIRLRAYFISEWRAQNGIEGDSAKDWLEAKRQLQEEAGKRN